MTGRGLGEQERDAMLAWVGENLTLVRRKASGQRAMYWILGSALVVGLAAHVGGFLLESSATTEPLSLAADLLYELGQALWTGVVVVVFVQLWPEAKSVSTSRPSMPTRRRQAVGPESEKARPRTRRARRRHDSISRRCGNANLGGRPPRYLGYSELNPSALKLWITSRTGAFV